MPRLQLESTTDKLDLDAVLKDGRGVQVRSGVTGLGLPAKQVQWLEGAGDGAIARGRRTLARDIDLPLLVAGSDREGLQEWLSRLAMVLADTATLRLIEDDGTDWSTRVEHVGGGDYAYGVDTIGEDDFFTVITLRAGDPYFTYSVPVTIPIGKQEAASSFLGTGLASMKIAPSQAMGDIVMENTGDATAYPVWKVIGPGRDFVATSPTGQVIHWTGTLLAGEVLTIDTKAGTAYIGDTNVYDRLAAAPKFWAIPPGKTTATVTLLDTTPGTSLVECSWRPRKWMVV